MGGEVYRGPVNLGVVFLVAGDFEDDEFSTARGYEEGDGLRVGANLEGEDGYLTDLVSELAVWEV